MLLPIITCLIFHSTITNVGCIPLNDETKCGLECEKGLKCLRIKDSNYTCAESCNQDWECWNVLENVLNTREFADIRVDRDFSGFFSKVADNINNRLSNPIITFDEFSDAVMSFANSYPDPRKYNIIVSLAGSVGNINSKRELAMFLTQILWESDGLKAVREYACVENGCPNNYKSNEDVPGKSYYGRGYIQLTWAVNYKKASHALFNDDRLFKNPDLVATDDRISWATAFWFWRSSIQWCRSVELAKGYFGATTDAINGDLECRGPNVHKGKQRFELYVKVLRAFNVNEKPIETGCYDKESAARNHVFKINKKPIFRRC